MLATATLVAAAGTPAMADAGDPFDTTVPAVFIGQGGGGATGLYTAVTDGDGAVAFQADGEAASVQYNAMGFNPDDGYIYAAVIGGPHRKKVARIGQQGAFTFVLGPDGNDLVLPEAGNAGVIGDDGLFYKAFDGRNWLEISQVTDPSGATNGLIDIVEITVDGTSANPGVDLVWMDGYLWTVLTAKNEPSSEMMRIDPADGTAQIFPMPELIGGKYGAMWIYGNGNLGVSDNTNGNVTQIEVSDPAGTPTFTTIVTQAGPKSSNNDGTSNRAVPVDLALTKTMPAQAELGSTVTIILAVENLSSTPSSGYVLTDTLPAELTGAATSNPACTIANNVLSCAEPALPAGESAEVILTATLAAPLGECVTNQAAVLGNERDGEPGNNTATATTCAPGMPDLALTKTASSTSVLPQGSVEYTVTVANVGGSPSGAFTLTDNVPEGLTDLTSGDCSIAGRQMTCTGDALAAGDSIDFTMSATVTAAAGTCLTNTATLDGEASETSIDNNTASARICVAEVETAAAVEDEAGEGGTDDGGTGDDARGLAYTGFAGGPLAALSVGLVALGAGLLALRRRLIG
ncbi:MAG: DUF11 domain-containing protein [Propioniciclava sp.]